jgi:hypothetical protein
MSLSREPWLELERLRYWQGQLLRSRDLRDQVDGAAHLRWWHNRALHNAYGVVAGLQVVQDGDALEVQAGLAYDGYGRELALAGAVTVPIPEGPLPGAGLTLLASYREPGRSRPAGDVCWPVAEALPASLQLGWRLSKEVSVRDGVALARLDAAGQLIESFARPLTRPLARPRIANGTTIPGNTPWQVWELSASDEVALFLGLEVEVDTSAAGFTATPCYFASLQGALWQPDLASRFLRGLTLSYSRALVNPLLGLGFLQLFGARFGHIHAPEPGRFTYRVWLPHMTRWGRTRSGLAPLVQTIAQEQKLSVCWLGIQPHQHPNEVSDGTF